MPAATFGFQLVLYKWQPLSSHTTEELFVLDFFLVDAKHGLVDWHEIARATWPHVATRFSLLEGVGHGFLDGGFDTLKVLR